MPRFCADAMWLLSLFIRGSIVKDDYNNNTEVWKFDKRFYTDPKIALKVTQGVRSLAAHRLCSCK
jgi:hypothetical protein